MAVNERSKPDDPREPRASRRRFLKALGAGIGAHFVLLNSWVFAAPKGRRAKGEDTNCGRTGNWTKGSAVFEDRDCGKRSPTGFVYTDEDCGKQSPHVYPGNATWWDSDCGKPTADPPFHNANPDNDCGLSRAGLGGAWSDSDCGKLQLPSATFNRDDDCSLPTGGLGRWTDKDCMLLARTGELHEDSMRSDCWIFW